MAGNNDMPPPKLRVGVAQPLDRVSAPASGAEKDSALYGNLLPDLIEENVRLAHENQDLASRWVNPSPPSFPHFVVHLPLKLGETLNVPFCSHTRCREKDGSDLASDIYL
jgi:hypothetical protein